MPDQYQHVSSTRGCPGNCTFCGSPNFWGHRVRSHSAAYFVHQLELLYQHTIQETILAYGKKLRNAFYQSLPGFVKDIEFIDDPEFDKFKADFCSRLAMTFSHGDYANLDAIAGKDSIAENLFRLNYRDHGNGHHLNKGLFYATLLDEVVEAVKQVSALSSGEPVYLVGFSFTLITPAPRSTFTTMVSMPQIQKTSTCL